MIEDAEFLETSVFLLEELVVSVFLLAELTLSNTDFKTSLVVAVAIAFPN